MRSAARRCLAAVAQQRRHPAALEPGAWKPNRAPQPLAAFSSLSSVIVAEQGKTRLQGYLPGGFILNNTQVDGPILCLPELWLMWDVGSLADVGMDSLAVLDLMAPPPEVLVVGCGARVRRLPEALLAQLAERSIAIEALDTRNALACFNFLNDEGRIVVGALLPCSEMGGDEPGPVPGATALWSPGASGGGGGSGTGRAADQAPGGREKQRA